MANEWRTEEVTVPLQVAYHTPSTNYTHRQTIEAKALSSTLYMVVVDESGSWQDR